MLSLPTGHDSLEVRDLCREVDAVSKNTTVRPRGLDENAFKLGM